jgi:hypothetical protein
MPQDSNIAGQTPQSMRRGTGHHQLQGRNRDPPEQGRLAHKVTLAAAQEAIAGNWVSAEKDLGL